MKIFSSLCHYITTYMVTGSGLTIIYKNVNTTMFIKRNNYIFLNGPVCMLVADLA